MKSQLRVAFIIVASVWLFLFVISGCASPTTNAPAVQQDQDSEASATATPMPSDDDVFVIAVLDPELLATAIPVLLSTPTENETTLVDAPDTTLALIDEMTWSIYRPIPNFSTSPEWEIPGLGVTTREDETFLSLPGGIDSGEVAVVIQNYTRSRFGDNSAALKHKRRTPTPCPSPVPKGTSELTIDALSEASSYRLPFSVSYSRIQDAFSSADSAVAKDLLGMAGAYVATEVEPSKIVLERNPVYGKEFGHSRIIFEATDLASLSSLDPPPAIIYDPDRQIAEPQIGDQASPKVIQSSEEFMLVFSEICPECRPPVPNPAPPCEPVAP